MSGGKTKIGDNHQEIWINPIGGYGDILMLSGVLKQYHDIDPHLKFCLVRRTIFTSLLSGHPAIKCIGHPPKNAHVISTDYWSKEKLGRDNQRPYQILARLFGLQTPIEENLYLPGNFEEDLLLRDFIPHVGKIIAIIAPTSIFPRKMVDPLIWRRFVGKISSKGIFVIQVGLKDDTHIKGAYSLLGLTTLRQLISILAISNVIISVDNFIMHAAHLIGKPSVIIWGPTDSMIYGYPEQIHIQCSTNHCELRNECLEHDFQCNSNTQCPFEEKSCMSKVPIDKIIENVINICFS